MADYVRVAGTGDVKPGHGLVAEVNGKTLAVFNIDGTFHAIDNTCVHRGGPLGDRKSTRLNSSHMSISYAVFCLKKKRPARGCRDSCAGRRRPPSGSRDAGA